MAVKVPIATIICGILPFVTVDLIRIAPIAIFPALSLALPALFFH